MNRKASPFAINIDHHHHHKQSKSSKNKVNDNEPKKRPNSPPNDCDDLPRPYLYQIQNCPKSLKSILVFYRCLGFSYSGVSFSENAESSSSSSSSSRIVSRLTIVAIVSLAINIAFASIFIAAFFIGRKSIRNSWRRINDPDETTSFAFAFHASNITSSSGNDTTITNQNRYDYMRSIRELKPILRYLIISTRYMLMFDNVVNLVWSAIVGGHVIRHLICTIEVDNVRRRKSHNASSRLAACKFVLVTITGIIGIFVVSFALANASEAFKWFRIVFTKRNHNDENDDTSAVADDDHDDQNLQKLQQFFRMISSQIIYFMINTACSVMFAYCMLTCGDMIRALAPPLPPDPPLDDNNNNNNNANSRRLRSTRMWINDYDRDDHADHHHADQDDDNYHLRRLERLRDELDRFAKKFKRLTRWFAAPITISLVIDVLMIVACACVLLLTNHVDSSDYPVRTIILMSGIYSMVRLCAICAVGGVPINAARDLTQTIFESFDECCWNIDLHFVFDDVIRISESFASTMLGGTYAVRQTTILAALGFALNYIVVLLQTENYGNKHSNRSG